MDALAAGCSAAGVCDLIGNSWEMYAPARWALEYVVLVAPLRSVQWANALGADVDADG